MMSELISGKEAKLAWANGEVVQIRNTIVGEDFYNIDEKGTTLNVFSLDFYEFRLKPRNITINGIGVPAPFEPKDGGEFWILFESHYSPCGYKLVLPDSQYSELCYGAWRTEEEIKQVVVALRSIFK